MQASTADLELIIQGLQQRIGEITSNYESQNILLRVEITNLVKQIESIQESLKISIEDKSHHIEKVKLLEDKLFEYNQKEIADLQKQNVKKQSPKTKG